jgi:hypothetical protein
MEVCKDIVGNWDEGQRTLDRGHEEEIVLIFEKREKGDGHYYLISISINIHYFRLLLLNPFFES